MILALDFDGVIWDSVGECWEMARRVYGKPVPDVEEAFRQGRWLARCGGDFLAILEMAIHNPERDWDAVTRDEFTQWIAKLPVDEFQKRFYAERERARTADPTAWASLQRPYDEMVAALPALRQKFAELVLCTTKDEASARSLLSSVGVEMSIWGREHGVDKGAQVRDLCEKRGIQGSAVVFVDDLLDNLEQVRPTGAQLYMAAWGYNTEREREEARRRGVVVLGSPAELLR